MYQCPECKGTNVLISMWVEANTEKIIDEAGQEPWCNDCEAHAKRLEVVDDLCECEEPDIYNDASEGWKSGDEAGCLKCGCSITRGGE